MMLLRMWLHSRWWFAKAEVPERYFNYHKQDAPQPIIRTQFYQVANQITLTVSTIVH